MYSLIGKSSLNLMLKKENVISLISAILLSWIILAAIPKANLGGIIPQTETQIMLLHLVATILFIYKLVRCFYEPKEADVFRNPLVYIPFLTGMLSFISGIFQGLPSLAWFGAHQTGQGAFWYFDLSIYTAFFIPLMQNKLFRFILFINLCFVLIIVTIFTFFPFAQGIPVAFYYFTDYLCFYGLFTFIVGLTLSKKTSFYYIGYLVIGYYFYAIDNRSAFALWCVVLGISIIYSILNLFVKKNKTIIGQLSKKIISALYSKWIFSLTPIVVSITILLSSIILWNTVGPLSEEVASSALASLVVRGKIIEVVLEGLYNLKGFLIGAGWGATGELLLANMNLAQYNQLSVANNVHFHTHSELFEHIISIGFPGFIIYMLYTFVILRNVMKKSILHAHAWMLYFAISSFWFLWSGTLPLLAIAAASTICYSNHKSSSLGRSSGAKFNILIKALLLFVSVFSLYGAFLGYYSIKQFSNLNFSEIMESSKKNNCLTTFDDLGRGGKPLASFYGAYVSIIVEKFEEERLEKVDVDVLKRLDCTINTLILKEKASLELINSAIVFSSKLVFLKNSDLFDAENKKYSYSILKERVLALARLSPKRNDLIVPFIAKALEYGDYSSIQKVCKIIKTNNSYPYCTLADAYILLYKPDLKEKDVKEAKKLIRQCIKEGLLDLMLPDFARLDLIYRENYKRSAPIYINLSPLFIPMSQDLIFTIKEKEANKLLEFIEKDNIK